MRHDTALVRINRSLARLRSMGVPDPELRQSVIARANELEFALLPAQKD